MVETLQLLVTGIENGISYGLVGLALVLIYKTSRALNFAQGTMAAIGGFAGYSFIEQLGWPWPVGAAAAVAIAAIVGLLVERVAIRPLLGAPLLSLVIVTLGVDSILTNVSQLGYGADARQLSPPLSGGEFNLGGVIIGRTYVVITVATVAMLVGLGLLLQRTRIGLAMRAFADDPFAAETLGIPPAVVSRTAWLLSAIVGGVTGLLFAPLVFVQVGFMSAIFIKGFTAAVLGGFTSLWGSVAGGLVLGVVEAVVIRYAPSQWAPMLPLLAILLVVLLRPRGVFTRGVVLQRV